MGNHPEISSYNLLISLKNSPESNVFLLILNNTLLFFVILFGYKKGGNGQTLLKKRVKLWTKRGVNYTQVNRLQAPVYRLLASGSGLQAPGYGLQRVGRRTELGLESGAGARGQKPEAWSPKPGWVGRRGRRGISLITLPLGCVSGSVFPMDEHDQFSIYLF